MPLLRTLRESCPDKINCPVVRLGPGGDLFVQGYAVSDPALLAELDPTQGKAVVRIPAAAAVVLLPELVVGTEKINCVFSRVGPNEDLLVQGHVVTDPVLLAELDLPHGETVVRIPAAEAAVLLPELSVGSASA